MNLNYNPQTHPLTICWFNTNRLRGLQLGQNEKVIKNITKSNYPAECVLVKVQGDDGQGKLTALEITFTGATEKRTWGGEYVPRTTIWTYKSYLRNGQTGSASRAQTFDKITIKNDLTYSELDVYLDYVKYILKQIADAGLV